MLPSNLPTLLPPRLACLLACLLLIISSRRIPSAPLVLYVRRYTRARTQPRNLPPPSSRNDPHLPWRVRRAPCSLHTYRTVCVPGNPKQPWLGRRSAAPREQKKESKPRRGGAGQRGLCQQRHVMSPLPFLGAGPNERSFPHGSRWADPESA